MVGILFVLLVLGVPVGIAFSLIIIVQADAWFVEIDYVAQSTLDVLLNYPLLAVPLFILAGELMTRGGLTRQIIIISRKLLGWSDAPLGYIVIGSSAMMGAITGSSVATVAAIGRALGPDMLRAGYKPGYVGAINAVSGLLGVLLPPSIPLILYGSVVGVSITQLFLATIGPAVVFIVAFVLVHMLRARHVLTDGAERRVEDGAPMSFRLRETRRALPALFMPVLVLGGIYSGLFTPTEAASIAALYAILYIVVGRTVSARELGDGFVRAGVSAAAVMFIIGFTALFNRALILDQVPQALAALAVSYTDSPLLFLLMVNLALLVVGMFMETSAATLLVGPLLAPAAAQYGIDPIHFGIIVVVNIEIGLLTPPLAANLYVASLTNRIPIVPLIRETLWFVASGLVCLLIVTYVPPVARWHTYLLP